MIEGIILKGIGGFYYVDTARVSLNAKHADGSARPWASLLSGTV